MLTDKNKNSLQDTPKHDIHDHRYNQLDIAHFSILHLRSTVSEYCVNEDEIRFDQHLWANVSV